MRKKILTIAVFSVMVLTVIGLAVGLVLVASRASMNNVMQISYVSNNVGARITAYGILYPNATGTENGIAIPTADGNDSETVEFYEDQEETNGSISFQTVDVTATSRAVYTFNITNTVSSTNTKELKALFAFNNLNDSDNVIIQVGTSESNATTINSTYNEHLINVGAGQKNKSVVVIMRVKDPAKDLKDFVANMQITLDYDIKLNNSFDWSNITTTDNLDVIWGILNNSNTDFSINIHDNDEDLDNTIIKNTTYTDRHSVLSDTDWDIIDITTQTTNRTDKFYFKVTYLTLDNSIIYTDLGIFDASASLDEYYGWFTSTNGETSNLPICTFLKDDILWGTQAENITSDGSWYDTDIKILIEITNVI